MTVNFAQSKDGKATKLYELFTSLTIARTDFDPKDIWGLCVSDGSSYKVAVFA